MLPGAAVLSSAQVRSAGARVAIGPGTSRGNVPNLPGIIYGGPVVVTATAGDTGPTIYATLKAAFDAINAGTHQGAINVAIVGDTTETVPAVLNASVLPASYGSILIQPSGGAARTISGAIAAGNPLIDLNGATNVMIDGLNSAGNSLTLSNSTVATTNGTSTVRFINGAQSNTITRCTVLGSANAAVPLASGSILFSNTTTGIANNNNMISFCNIGPAGTNLPTKGVTSVGQAGISNTGNHIENNNIFDFFSPTLGGSGIGVQGNNNSISNLQIGSGLSYQLQVIGTSAPISVQQYGRK